MGITYYHQVLKVLYKYPPNHCTRVQDHCKMESGNCKPGVWYNN